MSPNHSQLLINRWKTRLRRRDEDDENPAGFIELPNDFALSGGTGGPGQTYLSTCTCVSTCSQWQGCTYGCTDGCTDQGCTVTCGG
jgi:hypothetical protein